MKDTYSEVEVAQSITPAAHTSTATGDTVDRAGSGGEYYQHAMVAVTTGTITDGTHTITIEESDNDSDWAEVAAEDLQGDLPEIGTDDDDAVFEVGYLGLMRYLRVVSTVAGASSGGVYGAAVVLSGARNRPPARS